MNTPEFSCATCEDRGVILADFRRLAAFVGPGGMALLSAGCPANRDTKGTYQGNQMVCPGCEGRPKGGAA